MSDDKKSDERDQISTNDEEKVTEYIEVVKLQKLSSQKKKTILRNNLMKKSDGYELWQEIWWKRSDKKKNEEKFTEDKEVLKLGKLISHKKMDNIERYTMK